ncbi:hypothetical protein D3C74_487180 [compost metagenome]
MILITGARTRTCRRIERGLRLRLFQQGIGGQAHFALGPEFTGFEAGRPDDGRGNRCSQMIIGAHIAQGAV